MEILKTLPWIYIHLYMGISISQGKVCRHPGKPAKSKVEFSGNEPYMSGTYANYVCEEGYELFGSGRKICQENGQWSDEITFCAMNVAINKPSNYLILKGISIVENDGDTLTCAYVPLKGWWRVDLIKNYDIRVIRIWGLKGLDFEKHISIQVSKKGFPAGDNMRCTSYSNVQDYIEIRCNVNTVGRFVSIGTSESTQHQLCEVFVYSVNADITSHQCSGSLSPYYPFDGLCYYFWEQKGTWHEGRTFCQDKGGSLVHGITIVRELYLQAQLNRKPKPQSTKYYWIGQYANSSRASSYATWHWVNETFPKLLLKSSKWNDEPQQCKAIENGDNNGVRTPKTIRCNEPSYWICQFGPIRCSSPNQPPNSTIKENLPNFQVEESIHFECDEDHTMHGSNVITCQSNGLWNGTPPTCKLIDCGFPMAPINGSVEYYGTELNSTAIYQCDPGRNLMGNMERFCQGDGMWSGTEPLCYVVASQVSSCTGKIIGGVAGLIIFLAILIGVSIYLWKKHLLPHSCFSKGQTSYFTVEYNLNNSTATQDRHSVSEVNSKRSSVNHYVPPSADIDVLYAKVDPRKKKNTGNFSISNNKSALENLDNKNCMDSSNNMESEGINYENLRLNRAPIEKPPRKIVSKIRTEEESLPNSTDNSCGNINNVNYNSNNLYAEPHLNETFSTPSERSSSSVLSIRQFDSPLIAAYAETDILILPQADYEEISNVKT